MTTLVSTMRSQSTVRQTRIRWQQAMSGGGLKMQRNLVWVAVALGSIWLGIVIISVSGEDLVYGVERNMFPIVPVVTWVWGAIASGTVLNAMVQRHPSTGDQRNAWVGIAGAAAIIWLAVTIVALIVPSFMFEYGDSSIMIPLGSLIAAPAGALATTIAAQYVPLLTDVAASAGRDY